MFMKREYKTVRRENNSFSGYEQLAAEALPEFEIPSRPLYLLVPDTSIQEF